MEVRFSQGDLGVIIFRKAKISDTTAPDITAYGILSHYELSNDIFVTVLGLLPHFKLIVKRSTVFDTSRFITD